LFELFGFVDLKEKIKHLRTVRKSAVKGTGGMGNRRKRKCKGGSEGKARKQQRKMTSRRRKKE
jgi:hypothetical protein